VRTQAWFEFRRNAIPGSEVMKWVDPLPGVTHVSVWGYRNRMPIRAYLTLQEFENYPVFDNDTLEFIYDEPAETITVYAEGALDGPSQFFVKKGVRLLDLLNYIKVDKSYAKLESIYLRRYDVARRQSAALQESLFRLEQNVLTSTSDSVDEATIRVKEAELISQFVDKAKKVEPQGIVAISHKDGIENVYLQDGDIIVIPGRSDVVLISGEVVVPNAVVFNEKYTVKDYVAMSGGYGHKADTDNIILFKSDGRVDDAIKGTIEPGDAIMVLPKYERKDLQFAKDLTQIFFQIAVGTRALVNIF
jgi:protein involved in polysaccharide export with SLBB domain